VTVVFYFTGDEGELIVPVELKTKQGQESIDN